MRGYIKWFIGIDSRDVGRCYISDGVTTGFASSYFVLFKLGPKLRCLIKTNEVYLNVLTGGSVQVTAGIFIRDERNFS